MNPPVVEFNYIGANVVSTRVTVTTTSSISVSVITSKPVQIWSLIVQSNTQSVPTSTAILSNAQYSSTTPSTNHLLFHANLKANTEYIVYFTGKEDTGTLLANDITSTRITAKTQNEGEEDISAKSDGTLCESGWAISSSTQQLDLLPCSNHGYCQQSQCMFYSLHLNM